MNAINLQNTHGKVNALSKKMYLLIIGNDISWGSHPLPFSIFVPFLYFIQMDLKIAGVQNLLPHSRNYLKDVMLIDNWENYFR